MDPKIAVSRLKQVSILYDGDVYEFALWLLRIDTALSTPTTGHRHTLHGVANLYASITRRSLVKIHKRFADEGWSLRATVEFDEDVP